MLRKLIAVMFLVMSVTFFVGCFSEDDTPVSTISSNKMLEVEGKFQAAITAPTDINLSPVAFLGTPEKYSFSVVDKDTNTEIGSVTATGDSYKALIGISDCNLCPLIQVKEGKSGRILYSALLGKIPSAKELPASVETIKISGIAIDAASTARALLAIEKKSLIPDVLFSISTEEIQAGCYTKNFNGEKTNTDKHIENNIIGSENINEFAKAVTAVAAVLSASDVSDNLKNLIAPSITNATQLLTAFVKIARSSNGILKSLPAAQSVCEIKLAKIRIYSQTDDETITTIISKLCAGEKVEAPVFTPSTGTFSTAQNINITCPTSGAVIHYTIDGTVPTSSSAVYTGTLAISATSTIKAIAVKTGMADSDVAVAKYTINIPAPPQKVSTPVFSKANGTFTETQSVEITCATASAVIHYTIDGTGPTSSSPVYTGTLTVSTTSTIKAIAIKTDMTDSDVAVASYTINVLLPQASAPVFSKASGTYTETQSVEITCATPDAKIYYTLDGNAPTAASNLYSGTISVSVTSTIKAIAIKAGYTNSGVATASYTITIPLPKVMTPAFSVSNGTYTETQSVEISCTTANSKIYYTTDGAIPTAASTLYTGTISVSITSTIKAIAIKTGYTDSDVATASYTINLPLPKITAPIFNVSNGTYTETQSVEITCVTTGAKIYYTVDGTTPTNASTVYTGTISVSITSTIKAVAIKTGYTDSDVATANYTVNIPKPQVVKPEFSVPAGTYTTAQTLAITCATPGATIYYTMNGTDPTGSPLIYQNTITVATDVTVKAIAVKAGYTNSEIMSADYKVSAPTTAFMLTSPVLTNLGTLPAKYAKANNNISPAFAWGTPPAGTKSLMLVCVDDNGTPTNSMDDFILWGIYNISPTATGLAEGIAKGATVTSGVLPSGSAAQAVNDYGNTGYDGPDPATGAARTYAFQLFALNVEPNIAAGATKMTILPIIMSNVIAGTNLTVFYQK